MKSLMNFLLGIVLTIVGAILFLTNVKVSSFTFFYRYNGTNITAILILLMCILVVVYIVYPNFVTGLLLGIAFLAFFVSVIMSMKFYIVHMSALEVMVILATFCSGIGLTLRGIVHAKDDLPEK
ncbi:MAG: hypothetical protein J6J16_03885 [Lachnospiraceae bacterium]|nr:hypothetical protein [Lachnospiraceae bacterium]